MHVIKVGVSRTAVISPPGRGAGGCRSAAVAGGRAGARRAACEQAPSDVSKILIVEFLQILIAAVINVLTLGWLTDEEKGFLSPGDSAGVWAGGVACSLWRGEEKSPVALERSQWGPVLVVSWVPVKGKPRK